MIKEIIPPEYFSNNLNSISIFLAGTINMGDSFDWQKQIFDNLRHYDSKIDSQKNIILLNPRRTDFNVNCKQSYYDDYFKRQVDWELTNLNNCDYILMYLCKDNPAPISLLELGLYINSKKIFVCCEDGFYRQGNVEITCERYGVPIYKNLDDLINELIKMIYKDKNYG